MVSRYRDSTYLEREGEGDSESVEERRESEGESGWMEGRTVCKWTKRGREDGGGWESREIVEGDSGRRYGAWEQES